MALPAVDDHGIWYRGGACQIRRRAPARLVIEQTAPLAPGQQAAGADCRRPTTATLERPRCHNGDKRGPEIADLCPSQGSLTAPVEGWYFCAG
jgi:hypothetical protein